MTASPTPTPDDTDRAVKFIDWDGTTVMLTYNEAENASKVWTLPFGTQDIKSQLSTESFYYSDVSYNYDDTYIINDLAVYKDRLYAGCDGGLVIIFTSCIKCYQLRKPVSFDIMTMDIEDGVMYLTGKNDEEAEISMTDIGGDTIEPDEARNLIASGAILIDVRTAEEFASGSADGAVNIPIDELEAGLAAYDKSQTIIFGCASGARAERAVKTAASLGYTNTYSVGNILNL